VIAHDFEERFNRRTNGAHVSERQHCAIETGDLALDIQQNQRGPGDVRLLAAWQLARGPLAATALRASLKLPTGDSAKLTGMSTFGAHSQPRRLCAP
jgi:hypothetical protein